MNEATKAEMREKLGNISQLQDLLFGEHIREYQQRFDLYDEKIKSLEEKNRETQSIIDQRFEQLERKIMREMSLADNSLEKKIQYFNTTYKEEQQQIRKDLEQAAKQNDDSFRYLQDTINTQSSNLKTEIAQSKSAVDEEMRLLKQQINEKLSSSIAELSSGKVSHTDLAEVLFEISLKLKGTDVELKTDSIEQNGHSESPNFEENHN
ncbi:MAG: hypothetical protein AAGE96_13120 [Cyanobacteria bacterium P01_G01_bin.19]